MLSRKALFLLGLKPQRRFFGAKAHTIMVLIYFIDRVVIALCGGNIDTTALGRVIERGLAVDGRLVRFAVRVSDRPGGIAELTKMLADMGVR